MPDERQEGRRRCQKSRVKEKPSGMLGGSGRLHNGFQTMLRTKVHINSIVQQKSAEVNKTAHFLNVLNRPCNGY